MAVNEAFSKIMQGDEYALLIYVTTEDEEPIDSLFSDIEVSFGGSIRKTLKQGGVKYDTELGKFKVYLTQEETFKLRGNAKMQIRFKFTNGEVAGVDAGTYSVNSSISKVVL